MGFYGTFKFALRLLIFHKTFSPGHLNKSVLYSIKPDSLKVLLEAGCGVGNLFFPLLEEIPKLFIHACDFSKRAVQFVKVSCFFFYI